MVCVCPQELGVGGWRWEKLIHVGQAECRIPGQTDVTDAENRDGTTDKGEKLCIVLYDANCIFLFLPIL